MRLTERKGGGGGILPMPEFAPVTRLVAPVRSIPLMDCSAVEFPPKLVTVRLLLTDDRALETETSRRNRNSPSLGDPACCSNTGTEVGSSIMLLAKFRS